MSRGEIGSKSVRRGRRIRETELALEAEPRELRALLLARESCCLASEIRAGFRAASWYNFEG